MSSDIHDGRVIRPLTERQLLEHIMIALGEISLTLKAIKQQEKEYWETWKKHKEQEQ